MRVCAFGTSQSMIFLVASATSEWPALNAMP
jgi:hypothetical protein